MLKSGFLLPALLCWGAVAQGQKLPNPLPFGKTITNQDLHRHLSVIASAEMEGRDTPSPGLEKAADYISAQFKHMGLQPGNQDSYRQTFGLSLDSIKEFSLAINQTTFQPFVDFSPLFTNGESVNLNYKEYAFVGYGIQDEGRDDYAGMDVTGKLVVIMDGAPQGFQPSKPGRLAATTVLNKIKIARSKGATAVFMAMNTIPERYTSKVKVKPDWVKGEAKPEAPVFIIGPKVVETVSGYSWEQVLGALNQGEAPSEIKESQLSLNYQLQKSKAQASNVLGVIPGTDKKDEYLFITAHYDHVGKDEAGNIFYGADDDGSGTVAVIEMAEAFAKAWKAGKGPRRTVVFMTVSGEEKGLWGSEYYSDNPLFPLDKTTAALNIDMIGRVDTERMLPDTLNYVYVIGHNKLSTDLPTINEGANKKYTKLVLDYRFDDPNDPNQIYYRSDHYNFARKGVPVLFFYDGMLKADYHQPTDTIDKINFDLLTKRTKLVFYTAWEMANREEMVKRDLPLP